MVSAVVTLAVKDLRRSLRSALLMGMGLGAPLAISAIIALGFASADEEGFEPVAVAVVDERESAAERRAWRAMVNDPGMAHLLTVTDATSVERAREQLESRAVEAVIVLRGGEGATDVELYAEPSATVRPQIVEAVLDRLLDVQLGAALTVRGAPAEEVPDRMAAYVAWVGASSSRAAADVVPPDKGKVPVGAMATIKSRVMLAQLVFFAFFAAAFGAQTLLREEEEGTWSRLRTTAQPLAVLLAGKAGFLGVFVALQTLVFYVVARLVFDVETGSPLGYALSSLGLVFMSAGLGLLLISLVKTNKQAGPILGAVMPVFGMVGGLFTSGVPNLPPVMDTVALLVPHGWAYRGFELASAGASLSSIALTTVACLMGGLLLSGLALLRFRRRYRPEVAAS